MTIHEKLRQKREVLRLTLDEVAQVVGVSRQTVQKYESGVIANIPSDKIELLAKALQTSPAHLMGWDEEEPADGQGFPGAQFPNVRNLLRMPKMRRVPIIGAIACGTPTMAEENTEGYANAPDGTRADFCLRCAGDSMIGARICNGDIVYIKKDEDIIDGQIYAVLVNNDEATLKRVYRIGDNRLELRAENPSVAVQTYEGQALEDVRIIGRAIAFTSTIR